MKDIQDSRKNRTDVKLNKRPQREQLFQEFKAHSVIGECMLILHLNIGTLAPLSTPSRLRVHLICTGPRGASRAPQIASYQTHSSLQSVVRTDQTSDAQCNVIYFFRVFKYGFKQRSFIVENYIRKKLYENIFILFVTCLFLNQYLHQQTNLIK